MCPQCIEWIQWSLFLQPVVEKVRKSTFEVVKFATVINIQQVKGLHSDFGSKCINTSIKSKDTQSRVWLCQNPNFRDSHRFRLVEEGNIKEQKFTEEIKLIREGADRMKEDINEDIISDIL